MPFLTDFYTQHHCKHHTECWEDYQATDDAGKKDLFREQLPFKETLHGFFGKNTIEKIFMINAPIFGVTIGEMLWDPKYVEG